MFLLGKPSFWRNVSPTGAVRDFLGVWRDNPYRWRVLAVSAVLTGTMIYGFIPESQRAEPERPTVTYITSFAPDRTDAEIIASNIENQKLKEQRQALIAEREERRREAFRALGRATFLDVDALEKQYSEDPAPAQDEAASGDTVAEPE